MTTIIGNRQDTTRHLAQLSDILDRFVIPGVAQDQRQAIFDHLAWMSKQGDRMFVNCKLETVPEFALTRVVLEYSFIPIPSLNAEQKS